MSVIEMEQGLVYMADGEEQEYSVLFKLYTDVEEIVDGYMGGEETTAMHGITESREVDRATMLQEVTDIGVWGWSEVGVDLNVIHFWVDHEMNPEDIREHMLCLLAHEQGHLLRPYHKNMNVEEQKAQRYENVAQLAAMVTDQTIQAVHFNGLTEASDEDLAHNLMLYGRKAARKFKDGDNEGLAPLMAIAREMWRRLEQC